jgi:hypothetical protein
MQHSAVSIRVESPAHERLDSLKSCLSSLFIKKIAKFVSIKKEVIHTVLYSFYSKSEKYFPHLLHRGPRFTLLYRLGQASSVKIIILLFLG